MILYVHLTNYTIFSFKTEAESDRHADYLRVLIFIFYILYFTYFYMIILNHIFLNDA